jgi:hypothetical protein
LLCALATIAHGQSYQGGLRGSLRDNAGNALSTVTLSLTNEATRLTRTTVTNANGEYVLDRVDPGKYKLEATSGGFKKLERWVVIETQQQLLLDMVMEVGDVTETVVITDDAPLIESANASVG